MLVKDLHKIPMIKKKQNKLKKTKLFMMCSVQYSCPSKQITDQNYISCVSA